jgi:hypothetical protein
MTPNQPEPELTILPKVRYVIWDFHFGIVPEPDGPENKKKNSSTYFIQTEKTPPVGGGPLPSTTRLSLQDRYDPFLTSSQSSRVIGCVATTNTL